MFSFYSLVMLFYTIMSACYKNERNTNKNFLPIPFGFVVCHISAAIFYS